LPRSQNASKDRVMKRYRSLMKLNHPDLGGSPFISSKINEAKEMLEQRAKPTERFSKR